ncbi:membrane protein insertion efficiency factor YidD [Arthrobacter sp. A5]|uniref:membrane protein insertion efficiency factor YidD n=1 Tax=Arthrobacter sp. A5 TaxID=576926 RepID=UPI003DA8EB76
MYRWQLPASGSRRRLILFLGHSIWNLPRNLLILLLTLYRKLISPLYGPVCRFFPSCSAYALEAVLLRGAVRGSWLAGRRLLRCHPWNAGGIDHVPGAPHSHGTDPAAVPYIIQLNHPDEFLAVESDAEGREAA